MLTEDPGPQQQTAGPSGAQRPETGAGHQVAQGRTNAQIADRLCTSVRTVSSHLDRIRDKTGCRRRADLTPVGPDSGPGLAQSGPTAALFGEPARGACGPFHPRSRACKRGRTAPTRPRPGRVSLSGEGQPDGRHLATRDASLGEPAAAVRTCPTLQLKGISRMSMTTWSRPGMTT